MPEMREPNGYFGLCRRCGAVVSAVSGATPLEDTADLVREMILDNLDVIRMPDEQFRTDKTMVFGCRCVEGQDPLPLEETR